MKIQVIIHVRVDSDTYRENHIAVGKSFELSTDQGVISGTVSKVKECSNPLCAVYAPECHVFNLIVERPHTVH